MSAREEVRVELAKIIDEADDRWQHGIGSSGYDPDGPPLWLADAALAWLGEWLRGEEVREAVVVPICEAVDRDQYGDVYEAADAALGVLAGMLGADDE